MQRRDARSFFEEVLALVPDLSADTRDKLLGTVADKPGTKRASKLAAILAAEAEAAPAPVAVAVAVAEAHAAPEAPAAPAAAAAPAPAPAPKPTKRGRRG